MADTILFSPAGSPLISSAGELLKLDWAAWPATITVTGTDYVCHSSPTVLLGARTLAKHATETRYTMSWSQSLNEGGFVTTHYFGVIVQMHFNSTGPILLWQVALTSWISSTIYAKHRMTAPADISPFGTYTYYSGADTTHSITVSA